MESKKQLSAKQESILAKFKLLSPKEVKVSDFRFCNEKIVFDVQNARLYKLEGEDCWIVFGDLSQGYDMEKIGRMLRETKTKEVQETEIKEKEEVQPLEINEKDVAMLVETCNCTREMAIESLQKNDFDAIKALMDLNKQ